MPINYLTGKTYMSFDDLNALAVAYQHCKLDILPSLHGEHRECVERGLELMRDYWVEHKRVTAPFDYYGTTDPIRWLNT